MQPFRRAANPDGVLNRESVARLAAAQEPSARQKALKNFSEIDTDHDGIVTAAEMAAARSRPNGRAAARLLEGLLSAGGGKLSIVDVYRKPPAPDATPGRASLASRYDGYLALGDGVQITAAQLAKQATDTFRAVDSDGDTTISAAEFARARPGITKVRFAPEADIAQRRTIALIRRLPPRPKRCCSAPMRATP